MKFRTIIPLILSLLSLVSCTKEGSEQPHVILLSIDGFRHDYAERYQANNILDIAKRGVQASSLIPCYPSKTFPNHYSIITGLYPESHGIVDNYFYDPNRNDFYMANQGHKVTDGSWYGGTPLWSLADQQGLKTATFFWIGSEAEIDGSRPTYYEKYNSSTTAEESIEQLVNWLNLPEDKRPQFISAYFSLVDNAGHDFGIDSPELKKAVQEMDEYIGVLRKEIEKLKLPINLIIVSDHGMSDINTESPLLFEEIVDLDSVRHIYRDSHLNIYPKDSIMLNSLFDSFKNAEMGRYSTYKKSDIPEQYHYQKNDRIGDLLVVANPPNIFSPKGKRNGKGTHGYDPIFNDMHGIFYAEGPNVKPQSKINSFRNIHLYPFIADMLNLDYDTSAIDGERRVLEKVLVK
jgi:predicted AlkP superfamily pyrophosphatase or phosphodiesterase